MGFLAQVGNFIFSDVRMATSVLLAGLGLLLINRAGLMNIGAEGIMLMGALTGVLGSYYSGNVWVGMVSALLCGGLMGLLFAFLTVTLRANQIVVGAALNILGLGLSATINRAIFGNIATIPNIDTFKVWNIPLLSRIPVIGPALFSHTPIVYIAFIMVPLTSYFLFKTSWGLNLRSIGENPRVSDTLGVDVYKVKYLAAIVGCAIVGAGGAYLSTGLLSFFTEDMVSGRGYIALAAVIFGKYKPTGVMIASLIFMAGNVIANYLQAFGVPIPYTFASMIPYILTIVALALFAGKASAPAALGQPYKKG